MRTLVVWSVLASAGRAAVDLEEFSARLVVQQCSLAELSVKDYQMRKAVGELLNVHCLHNASVRHRCALRHDAHYCAFDADNVRHLAGYPRMIGDSAIMLKLYVVRPRRTLYEDNEAACASTETTPTKCDPFPGISTRSSDALTASLVPKAAVIGALHEGRRPLATAIDAPVLELERLVPYGELMLQRHSFTVGLGTLLLFTVAMRMFLKSRERAKMMDDFWLRQVQRTRRNAATLMAAGDERRKQLASTTAAAAGPAYVAAAAALSVAGPQRLATGTATGSGATHEAAAGGSSRHAPHVDQPAASALAGRRRHWRSMRREGTWRVAGGHPYSTAAGASASGQPANMRALMLFGRLRGNAYDTAQQGAEQTTGFY